MNTVNRVVVVVLLIVVAVLCGAVLVVPIPVLNAVARQSAALVGLLSSLQWYVRVPLGVLFALTLLIICILLIIAEVRRPARKFVRVEKVAGGEVLVSIASIADRLRYEVDGLANVLRVKTKVSARRKGVVVALEVETAANIDVPLKAEQIVETARQVVEEGMGLKLARPPKVSLRAVPYPTMVKAPAPSSKLPGAAVEPKEPSFAEALPSASITPAGLEESPPGSSEED